MSNFVAFLDTAGGNATPAANTVCVLKGSGGTDVETLVPTVVQINPTTGVITGASMPASGDVDGPASATDNALARFDGTTGKIIQNSVVVVSDTGQVTGVTDLTAAGTVSVNATGAGVTTIGTGGTGAVNIGNATGNTAVTGSLTASTGLVATTGGIAATGTSNINTSGAAVTSIGTGGTGAVNIGNATGNTAVTGSLTAAGNVIASLSSAGATVSAQVTNSDNTNAASNAQLQLAVGGASGGDPGILLQVSGVAAASWYLATDNSAGDILLIGEGETVGTTPAISIAHTTLDVTVSAGALATAVGGITSATTLTATSGAITATNGNLVLGTAGNKLSITEGANASMGVGTLVGGTLTVSTSAVTANSRIFLTRASIGATGAAALGQLTVGTVTPGASFVINAVTAADATALQASDVSLINWVLIN